jgi:hypothetical protein
VQLALHERKELKIKENMKELKMNNLMMKSEMMKMNKEKLKDKKLQVEDGSGEEA